MGFSPTSALDWTYLAVIQLIVNVFASPYSASHTIRIKTWRSRYGFLEAFLPTDLAWTLLDAAIDLFWFAFRTLFGVAFWLLFRSQEAAFAPDYTTVNAKWYMAVLFFALAMLAQRFWVQHNHWAAVPYVGTFFAVAEAALLGTSVGYAKAVSPTDARNWYLGVGITYVALIGIYLIWAFCFFWMSSNSEHEHRHKHKKTHTTTHYVEVEHGE